MKTHQVFDLLPSMSINVIYRFIAKELKIDFPLLFLLIAIGLGFIFLRPPSLLKDLVHERLFSGPPVQSSRLISLAAKIFWGDAEIKQDHSWR